jgi:hypothetical protein
MRPKTHKGGRWYVSGVRRYEYLAELMAVADDPIELSVSVGCCAVHANWYRCA